MLEEEGAESADSGQQGGSEPKESTEQSGLFNAADYDVKEPAGDDFPPQESDAKAGGADQNAAEDGSGGTKEGEQQAPESPEWLDKNLGEMAKQFGMDPTRIAAFGSNAALGAGLQVLAEAFAADGQRVMQQQEQQGTQQQTQPQQQQTQQQAQQQPPQKTAEQLKAEEDAIAKELEEYPEAFQKMYQNQKSMEGRINQLLQGIEQLVGMRKQADDAQRQQEQSRLQREVIGRVEAAYNKLPKDFDTVFGKGPFEKLPQAQQKARVETADMMTKIANHFIGRNQQPPSEEALMNMAIWAMHRDKAMSVEKAKQKQKEDAWGSQTTIRPNGRPPRTGMSATERAIAAVREKKREHAAVLGADPDRSGFL